VVINNFGCCGPEPLAASRLVKSFMKNTAAVVFLLRLWADTFEPLRTVEVVDAGS
jgi:hypothetical protein